MTDDDGTNFSQNLGDLHLLLRLIDNWERYKKKPEFFHSENLASLTLYTSRKMFTLAKFYGLQEHENSLSVLRNWLKTGDGSWFSGGLWTELQTQKPELVEAVLAGNYDPDMALNSQVSTLESYY
jgi:hypothetical protein